MTRKPALSIVADARPRPSFAAAFEPAPGLQDWIKRTFLRDNSPLFNPDHAHLTDARLGVVWTTVENTRQMRSIIGQAELMPPAGMMGKWAKARLTEQLIGWFGDVPDFLLTFSAPAAESMDDASFCALVEHELYHCAQERDEFGMPKFTRDGHPKFAMRGHDVEEFIGVVARYGATDRGVRALVDAANAKPLIAAQSIAAACGTCLARAA